MSAQNRVRLYWTNIANEPFGLFGDMQCMIPQPKDKGILLKDILESEVPDKYYLSEKMLAYFKNRAANFNQGKVNIREEEGKSSCLTSSMASCDISDNFIKVDTTLKPSKNQDKANCFTAGGNSGGLHSDMTFICIDTNGRISSEKTGTIPASYASGPDNYYSRPFIVASRGRNPENPKNRESGLNTEQMLEPRFDGKTNCLTSVQKDNLVMQIPEATKKGYAEVKPGDCFDLTMPDSETRRGRLMEDKSNCLTAAKFDFMQYTEDYRIRRLTPTECERLQTVPDWYDMSIVSDTQRYRMLGNGWTVDVISYIFSFMKLKTK
jgi:DNA (cytosine-5)-methyltransferase 3A